MYDEYAMLHARAQEMADLARTTTRNPARRVRHGRGGRRTGSDAGATK